MSARVQVGLLAYRLFGGSINHGKPGDEANMFSYQGPKGILVGGMGGVRTAIGGEEAGLSD